MPLGREDTVSVRGAAETVTVTGPVEVAAGLPESVAFTVMLVVPAVVGVPFTTQPLPRVRPAGSDPAVREQV